MISSVWHLLTKDTANPYKCVCDTHTQRELEKYIHTQTGRESPPRSCLKCCKLLCSSGGSKGCAVCVCVCVCIEACKY